MFQFGAAGGPTQTAWTTAESGNAFLALDRNHNGIIDNATELFGNFTPQPKSRHPNGFLALAVFDKPENGGNGDGIIDNRDAVFAHLLLWIDANHDGVSQAEELHTLPELGVYSLALHYRESRREDQFGNVFRYKAAVNPDPRDGESKDGCWTYDVFFAQTGTPPLRRSGIAFMRPYSLRAAAAAANRLWMIDSIWETGYSPVFMTRRSFNEMTAEVANEAPCDSSDCRAREFFANRCSKQHNRNSEGFAFLRCLVAFAAHCKHEGSV